MVESNPEEPTPVLSAAQELSKLGASKGGRARANVLSPEQRREIAKKAIEARWTKAGKVRPVENETVGPRVEIVAQQVSGNSNMPYSMFPGTLKIGDMEVECHVLNDGRRVFTQREVVRVLSGGRESGNLGRYLDRNPLFDHDFESGPTIKFRIPKVVRPSIGHEATLLIEICERYLEARRLGLLLESQMKLAIQSEIIISACAKVGIIALVDEATGFTAFKKKQEYQLKLQAFIAEEMQEWARMFPEEFWFELARLENIHYSARSRPLRWGKYVMAFVYDAVDGDVGKKLREKNPDPHFKQNHHQWLKEFGRQKVHDQIQRVVTIMKLCDDMDDFRRKFAKVFQRASISSQMNFDWGMAE